MTTQLTPRQQRAYARWKRRQRASATYSARLARPRTTTALIATYAGSLAVAALSWLVITFAGGPSTPVLAIYLACMILSALSFTCIRISIGSRDTAPAVALDDYENEVLQRWRSRAFLAMSWALSLGGFAFAFLGPAFLDPASDSPAHVAINAGLYMIFVHLATTTLPTVGYAAAFNRNLED